MKILAPIVLFVYNRPEHTQNTVKALLQNELASDSELFIFSDGWEGESDKIKVEEVRKYINSISGFLKINIIERKRNYGLADSIIKGVTEIVTRYGRIIVLEDDIVTSKYFLRYMNDALIKYVNEERVMHIAAHMFPIKTDGLDETFFTGFSSCWGWGTWKRAWDNFENNSAKYIKSFKISDIEKFNLNGAYDYWGQLYANYEKKIHTWAIFWYASIFLNNGLCLHPRESLVKNIGFDGSGVNCGVVNNIKTSFSERQVVYFPCIINKNNLAEERYRDYLIIEQNSKNNIFKIIIKIMRIVKKYHMFNK